MELRRPVFGVASVVFAVLSILVPVLVMVLFGHEAGRASQDEKRNQFWEALGLLLAGAIVSVFAAGITSLLGSVSGGVALLRRESKRWLSVVGLVVNLPILSFIVFLFAVVRMNQG